MRTSHRCCESFTGCGLRNASISRWLCLFTNACMVWCHSIFLNTSTTLPFQLPPSQVIIILAVAASDQTYTAVQCWRSCICGVWKRPLEQSVSRRLSSNAAYFSEPPQNLSFYADHFLPNCFWFLVLYAVYTVKSRIQYAHLYNTHPKLSQENCGKTLV